MSHNVHNRNSQPSQQHYSSHNNRHVTEEAQSRRFGEEENQFHPNIRSYERDSRGSDFPPFLPLPNPLTEVLADLLENSVRLLTRISYHLYTNSSVMVIASGLAGTIHHFASPRNPLANAALEAGFPGSVAVAKYVGWAFFIKTALTPIHERFTGNVEMRYDDYDTEERISSDYHRSDSTENQYHTKELKGKKHLYNSYVVSYLTPMALAWVVSYATGIPVKYANATAYTLGTFGLMKLLGKGYDYALAAYF